MGAAHRKCTRAEPNCRDLAIGKWNVSSLTGKEQELACEAQQYRLDVRGITSTKRRGSGTVELNGGWKIFYFGVNAAMSAQAGVGLLVSPNQGRNYIRRGPGANIYYEALIFNIFLYCVNKSDEIYVAS